MSRIPAVHPPRPDCAARQHDTRWAYSRWGCTCPTAIALNAESNRRRNQRRQPVPGARHHARGRAAGGRVDQTRVAEAVAGQPVTLNSAELAAALDLYDVSGRSAAEVARRLGCTTRTVTRRRAARRQVAA